MDEASGLPPLRAHLIDMMYARKQYRTPFKVHCMSWSPCRDLLALASRRGDVCVKRSGWKSGWKTSVLSARALPAALSPGHASSASLESMCWSPDGLVLAVAQSDGVVHLLEAEHGNVVYSVQLSGDPAPSVLRLRWQSLGLDGKMFVEDDARMKSEEEKLAMRVPCLADETAGELAGRASHMASQIYTDSLRGTVLMAMCDDNTVHVLLGGVMVAAVLRPDTDHFHSSLGLYVVAVHDAWLDVSEGGVAVAYTNYGPRPPVSRGCVYGEPHKEGEKGDGNAANTHIVCSRVCVLSKEPLDVWECVERYAQLYASLVYTHNALELASKDWQHEMKMFVRRWEEGANFAMGDAFLTALITGQMCEKMLDWLETCLKQQGVTAMREYLSKKYSETIGVLSGGVRRGADRMAAQAHMLDQAIRRLVDAPSTGGDEHTMQHAMAMLFPARNDDVSVYPMGGVCGKEPPASLHPITDLSHAAHTLCASVQHAIHQATKSVRELLDMVNWIQLFPPIMKFMVGKKQVLAVRQCRKWDIRSLAEFMNTTFNDGEKRRRCEKMLFHLDRVMDEELAEMEPSRRDELLGQHDESMEDEMLTWAGETRNPPLQLDKLGACLCEGQAGSECVSIQSALSAVASHLHSVCSLLDSATPSTRSSWVYELESGVDHVGFDAVEMGVWEWNVDESELEKTIRDEMEKAGADKEEMKRSLCVYTVKDNMLEGRVLWRVGCPEAMHRILIKGGLQRGDGPTRDVRLSLIDEETSQGHAMALHIETAPRQEMTILKMTSIASLTGGAYYALVKMRGVEGERNRVVKGHLGFRLETPAGEELLVVHEDPLRAELYEALAVSNTRGLGAALSDEGSRITWFELHDEADEEEEEEEEMDRGEVGFRSLAHDVDVKVLI